jgi:hypothetical protein
MSFEGFPVMRNPRIVVARFKLVGVHLITCEICGHSPSLSWTPIARSFEEDFKDFRDREHDHSSEQAMFNYAPSLVNGENASSQPFIMLFNEAYDVGQYQLADMHLRFAANRGDWFAMMMLVEFRAEIEHDDEAWRWAARVVYLLSNPKNEFIPYIPSATRESVISDAQDMMDICLHNGADSHQMPPNDVGVAAEYHYCLAHGTLITPGSPSAPCDDSVHLSRHIFGQ